MDNQIVLLPHNEMAYNKLNKTLENNQMATINHATGTGKSFIMLKYMYENRDKKILYFTPTYQIIDQLLNEHMEELNINKDEFDCLDTAIYSNIIKMNLQEMASKYDIIILDEYHRCGAKTWEKRIIKLLEIIKNEYPNKKVIGTTATEIRYLDNEKNMNNILFDGICASELSLTEAILQGILPVPIYVNSMYDFYEQIDILEKRVNRLMPYENDKKNLFSLLSNLKEKIEKMLEQENEFEQYLPNSGKYLVFSSTIDQIGYDKKIISNIFKNKIDKEYVITCQQSHKKNNTEIRNFRNDSSDLNSIMYSVNLLNEGLHVKNIDAIFMLRKTISPRIYFQQLGRLLSYSKRKDKVVVFDLVNNIKNNKVIYNLYKDTIEEAKKRIVTDPANQERYKYILETFKIINKASEISSELDKFNELLSNKNIIEYRLNIAVDILSNKRESNEIEKMQAILDIFKFKTHIDLNLFKRIMILNIEKPSIFDYTINEFEEYIKPFKNINEKEQYENNRLSNQINEFYDKNNRLPSIFSENKEEYILAYTLINNYNYLDSKFQKRLSKYGKNNISTIEKILYGVNIKEINYNVLYNEIETIMNFGVVLNDNLINILSKNNSNISKKSINLILKNNDNLYKKMEHIESIFMIDDTKDNKTIKDKFDTNLNVLFRLNFMEFAKKEYTKYEQITNKKEYIMNFVKEYIIFMKNNLKKPLLSQNNKNDSERELFYKKIIYNEEIKKYGLDKEIEELNYIIKTNKELLKKELWIKKIMTFKKEHKDSLPSKLSSDTEEKKIARKLKHYIKVLTKDEMDMIMNIQEFKEEKQNILKKYILFIKRKKRKPQVNMNDEYEKQLALSYDRYELLFTKEEKIMVETELNKVSKYKQIESLYLDMLIEKKEKRK